MPAPEDEQGTEPEDRIDIPDAPDGPDGDNPGGGGEPTPDVAVTPDHDTGIYARESPYLERCVQLGVASERLINVSFPGSPGDDAEPDHPLLDRLFAYLEGERDEFTDVDIALTVPTEQRTVLEAVRNVPYGEDVSVERLARMAGLDDENEADVTTVRTALGANPVPVVVPDHRIRDGPSSAPPRVEQRLRSLEGL
ncbi:cysteine methyltransferase [Halobacteriales archaeon QS_4_70_19]|nr:MAG: cysteine methyltransferase [Halobacteriales archaeon QS_4_70_19]